MDLHRKSAPHPIIRDLLTRLEPRANSVLITIFGDAVLPRGGTIWLGSLIILADTLLIAERLVRTGVYRLSREGWLKSQSRGRRAYYTLTETGFEKFHEAQRRIYGIEPVAWDGEWRLVQILPSLPQAARQALRRELGWLGFGQIGQTLFAHPTERTVTIAKALSHHNSVAHTLTFRAELADFVQADLVHQVVQTAWGLEALNQDYSHFLDTFAPLDALLEDTSLSPADAFALRILIVHDYRRVLLKDPVLPEQLLPPGWLGEEARTLAARLYRKIAASADSFLVSNLETPDGIIPPLSAAYARRFGGIEI